MMSKGTALKVGRGCVIAGIVLMLAAFPVDDGSFLWYGFVLQALGGALRFWAKRMM